MTQIPADELEALGSRFMMLGSAFSNHTENAPIVLELGNKKNSTGLYRDWYISQGFRYTCLDWNGEDGALPWDFNHPISSADIEAIGGPFAWVTNFGFSEHVEKQLPCWLNIHRLVAKGGRLCCCMPQMPYWKGHGLWQPSMDWYREFAELNGYVVETLHEFSARKRPTIVCRLQKVLNLVQFTMPETEIENANS